jgi:cell division protease FtsH
MSKRPTRKMTEKASDPRKPPRGESPPPRPVVPAGFVLVAVVIATFLLFGRQLVSNVSEIKNYNFFDEQVRAGNVKSIDIQGDRIFGEFVEPPLAPTDPAQVDSTENDASTNGVQGEERPAAKEQERLRKNFVVRMVGEIDAQQRELFREKIPFVQSSTPPFSFADLLTLIWIGLFVVLAFSFWSFMRRTRDQVFGGGMLSGVTRSPARRYDEQGQRTTFDDVAGLGGVKKDLQEIIAYLKDPDRFHRLGARVPKGVLLMGPPGTGKTLLAKAVAGEAGVPFFSISGSEFIQLFVGVGAGRVRDMFKTAKENAPAILFIDEIDAVGRQRGAGLGGGHDEREQTLNQILSEMDGFGPATSVIVIAATNRPDVLDPALLRPGRFDRHITVDRPTVKGRKELFEVHSRDIPLADDVDLDRLAQATVGLTGADIRNLVNEAALWATRHDKQMVDMEDFEYARDKVLMGALRDDVLTDEERLITAYHEAGHALLAWYEPGCDRVHKMTIVPRGRSLGVTQLVPEEDRHNLSQRDIQSRLAMLLAGRAAEKMHFDEYSAGAENDLQEATKLARRMVTHWGMSDRLGPVAFHTEEENPFLGREHIQAHRHFSEHTAQVIDEEVAKILHAAEDRAKRTLADHKHELTRLADALLEKEILTEDEIEELIGPSVQSRQAVALKAERDAKTSQVASVRPRD